MYIYVLVSLIGGSYLCFYSQGISTVSRALIHLEGGKYDLQIEGIGLGAVMATRGNACA